jgi:hypothetical protein
MRWDLEEIARITLEEHDMGTPVNTEVLAKKLKLTIHTWPECEGVLVGTRIFVDPLLREERRQFAIGHEIGHYLRRQLGLEDAENVTATDERAADYLAAALLQPRLDFEAALKRHGWDLIRLHAIFRNASFEAIARRIVALRDARAVVHDRPLRGQRPAGWYTIPWEHRPTHEERLAVEEAIACGAPVELRTGLTAWPVLQHDWHRAIALTAL